MRSSALNGSVAVSYTHLVFEQTVAICGKPKEVSNWLMTEVMRLLKEQEQEPEDMKFSPENLAKLISLVEKDVYKRQLPDVS